MVAAGTGYNNYQVLFVYTQNFTKEVIWEGPSSQSSLTTTLFQWELAEGLLINLNIFLF